MTAVNQTEDDAWNGESQHWATDAGLGYITFLQAAAPEPPTRDGIVYWDPRSDRPRPDRPSPGHKQRTAGTVADARRTGVGLLRASGKVTTARRVAWEPRPQPGDHIVGLDLGAGTTCPIRSRPRDWWAGGGAVVRQARGPLAATAANRAAGARRRRPGAGRRGPPGPHAGRCGLADGPRAESSELLAFLVRHPRRAFRHEELLEGVWGYRYGDASTVTVHVRRLRERGRRRRPWQRRYRSSQGCCLAHWWSACARSVRL
jgi:Transcriptional regulatory protein, C terminal